MNATSTEREVAPIALGDPHTRDVDDLVLDAPGGFAWWYLDLVNEAGDGAVLIWSFGLPFLPGYLSGNRAGRGDRARERPSLNVAIYRGGRRAFYLLQAYAPEDAELDGQGNFRFGESSMHRTSDSTLELHLSCPLPQTSDRLEGKLTVEGASVRFDPSLKPTSDLAHRWTPVLGPSWAEGTLRAGGERYDLAAPAYHDRNEGVRRLDDLGIDHWVWGRLVRPERTSLWYLTYPKSGACVAWGAEIDGDGTFRLVPDLEPLLERPERGSFGLRTWQTVRLRTPSGADWLTARTRLRVDDGPFYARTLADVETETHRGRGLGEWIVPDRIDLAQHRPLVRMAVHDLQGRNSMWLPLFSGPKAGRLARLLRLAESRPRATPDNNS